MTERLKLTGTLTKITDPARVREAYRQREPAVVAAKQAKMLAHIAEQRAKMASKEA